MQISVLEWVGGGGENADLTAVVGREEAEIMQI